MHVHPRDSSRSDAAVQHEVIARVGDIIDGKFVLRAIGIESVQVVFIESGDISQVAIGN
ncbi:MAG TPA: hypothetical protein VMU84_06745 [Thermoanaerobaculia bacterium]|nr:hypothetical protein [Thermoanaerobaculia bacterium]